MTKVTSGSTNLAIREILLIHTTGFVVRYVLVGFNFQAPFLDEWVSAWFMTRYILFPQHSLVGDSKEKYAA